MADQMLFPKGCKNKFYQIDVAQVASLVEHLQFKPEALGSTLSLDTFSINICSSYNFFSNQFDSVKNDKNITVFFNNTFQAMKIRKISHAMQFLSKKLNSVIVLQ